MGSLKDNTHRPDLGGDDNQKKDKQITNTYMTQT